MFRGPIVFCTVFLNVYLIFGRVCLPGYICGIVLHVDLQRFEGVAPRSVSC